jgi:hypothetical protein
MKRGDFFGIAFSFDHALKSGPLHLFFSEANLGLQRAVVAVSALYKNEIGCLRTV